MGTRLKILRNFLNISNQNPTSVRTFPPLKIPTFYNTDNVIRQTWVASSSAENKRLGLKLQFPTVKACHEFKNKIYPENVAVDDESNRTEILENSKNPAELTILPVGSSSPSSSKEILQDALWKLAENPNGNYTLLRVPKAKGVKTIVEFSSPNIAKPLHMGHLRSTITGNFIGKIHAAMKDNVSSFCFLGDWGTQFGLLHAGLATWTDESKPLAEIVKHLTLNELLEFYIRAVKEDGENPEFATKARQYSAALEQGQSDAVEVWRSIREKSVDHLQAAWDELGVHFDVLQGESDYTMKSSHMKAAMKLMQSTGIIQTAEDGRQFTLANVSGKSSASFEPKEPTKVNLVKSDGSSLYILRDIAAAFHRINEYPFDRLIYIVDGSQSRHFLALFDILSQLGLNKPKSDSPMFQHISFGRISGQSTRSGTFSLLSDVLRDGTELMNASRAASPNTRLQENTNISKTLALSSLIINFFKVRRNKDLNFDWNEALKTSGDTGVSLQYAHARLASLELKLLDEFMNEDKEFKVQLDFQYILNDPIALELAIQLLNYEEALWSSFKDLEPCTLVTYSFRLRDKVYKALKELPVKAEENKNIAATRWFLFILARHILAYNLSLLGVEPLDQM